MLCVRMGEMLDLRVVLERQVGVVLLGDVGSGWPVQTWILSRGTPTLASRANPYALERSSRPLPVSVNM